MLPRLTAVLLTVLAAVLLGASSSRAGEALTFCLDKSGPASPPQAGKEAHAFDLAVAQAVARHLGRTPIVLRYESEVDSDSNPDEQVNALLSDGHCQLVLGYPLFATAIGTPRARRSRLPSYDGGKPADRRRWVPLNEVIASQGYRFDPMVVVLGPSVTHSAIHSLADLKGMRLAAEEGTLADAILMTYDRGALIGRITHVKSDRELFEVVERGEYDATLVELHRLDAYLAQHPGSGLSSSGHYHSVGFNIGMVGLASEAALMAEVNAAIGEMLAKGELTALAQTAGITYLPPREPNVSATVTAAELRGD